MINRPDAFWNGIAISFIVRDWSGATLGGGLYLGSRMGEDQSNTGKVFDGLKDKKSGGQWSPSSRFILTSMIQW